MVHTTHLGCSDVAELRLATGLALGGGVCTKQRRSDTRSAGCAGAEHALQRLTEHHDGDTATSLHALHVGEWLTGKRPLWLWAGIASVLFAWRSWILV